MFNLEEFGMTKSEVMKYGVGSLWAGVEPGSVVGDGYIQYPQLWELVYICPGEGTVVQLRRVKDGKFVEVCFSDHSGSLHYGCQKKANCFWHVDTIVVGLRGSQHFWNNPIVERLIPQKASVGELNVAHLGYCLARCCNVAFDNTGGSFGVGKCYVPRPNVSIHVDAPTCDTCVYYRIEKPDYGEAYKKPEDAPSLGKPEDMLVQVTQKDEPFWRRTPHVYVQADNGFDECAMCRKNYGSHTETRETIAQKYKRLLGLDIDEPTYAKSALSDSDLKTIYRQQASAIRASLPLCHLELPEIFIAAYKAALFQEMALRKARSDIPY